MPEVHDHCEVVLFCTSSVNGEPLEFACRLRFAVSSPDYIASIFRIDSVAAWTTEHGIPPSPSEYLICSSPTPQGVLSALSEQLVVALFSVQVVVAVATVQVVVSFSTVESVISAHD